MRVFIVHIIREAISNEENRLFHDEAIFSTEIRYVRRDRARTPTGTRLSDLPREIFLEYTFNPFSTPVPIWGQTSLIPSDFSPS